MYNMKEYWEKRLLDNFTLKGVGFKRYSDNYNTYLYKLKIRAVERVISQHGINIKDKSVLDIGCGTGFWVEFYENIGAQIVGIDITETSINSLIKRFPHHHFYRLDIGTEEYSLDTKFDIVNAFDIIYHITENKLFEKALKNIALSARNGAFILITDTLCTNEGFIRHVRHRDLDDYTRIFETLNIEILNIVPIYHFMNQTPSLITKLENSISFKLGKFIVNSLAPLYYFFDRLYLPLDRSNMKLLVCFKNRINTGKVQ